VPTCPDPGISGQQKTWTWAGWVKRTAPDTGNYLFMCQPDASNYSEIYFDTDNRLKVSNRVGGTDVTQRFTTQVLRDYSAWYHVVISIDRTQSTSTDRFKVYLNGVDITANGSTSYGDQNSVARWPGNSTSDVNIGRFRSGEPLYYNGYLADIHFIDGQALDPSSFGEFDTNGVWQPIDAFGHLWHQRVPPALQR
jgi:hypothetical protein